jgi:hypothetical protein
LINSSSCESLSGRIGSVTVGQSLPKIFRRPDSPTNLVTFPVAPNKFQQAGTVRSSRHWI